MPRYDPTARDASPFGSRLSAREQAMLVAAGVNRDGTMPGAMSAAVPPQPMGGSGFLSRAIAAPGMMGGQPPAMPQPSMPQPAGGGIINAALSDLPAPAMAPAPMQGQQMQAAPDMSGVKPHRGFDWGRVAGIAADALSGAAGLPPTYALAMRRKHDEERQLAQQAAQWSRQDAQRTQDRQWQVEDRDVAANRPQYFMAGRDRVAFDPASGQSQVVYDGPEDYQSYAATLGMNPGDEGYDGAVQDYVLRSAGPTSQAARRALVTTQQNARMVAKAAPTYRDLHPAAPRSHGAGPPRSPSAVVAPILLKMSRGEALTPAERETLAYTRPNRGGRQSPKNPDSMIPGTAALPVTVTSPEQARMLPPGTVFRNPQGKVMTR